MKIIFIIVMILLIVGSVFLANYYLNRNKIINLGGIEISSKNLADLTEPLPEGKFILCDIEKDKCILSRKENIE